MSASDIVYETQDFWVRRVTKGFEVYRKGSTSSTRCAFIGNGAAPSLGIERAIVECNRRQEQLEVREVK